MIHRVRIGIVGFVDRGHYSSVVSRIKGWLSDSNQTLIVSPNPLSAEVAAEFGLQFTEIRSTAAGQKQFIKVANHLICGIDKPSIIARNSFVLQYGDQNLYDLPHPSSLLKGNGNDCRNL